MGQLLGLGITHYPGLSYKANQSRRIKLLLGAMAELSRRPDEAVFLESWISNSDKVFTVFRS